MNNEQRRRDRERLRKTKLKEIERSEKEKVKQQNKYPSFINTLLKRLRRIDPWNNVASLNIINCVYITFYKLRQFGMLNLRIAHNNTYTWIEFEYDGEWWTFEPIAVRLLKLGEPIKRVKYINNDIYNNLNRYFYDITDFETIFKEKLEYSSDEAKIEAMKDSGLNSVLRIKYF